MMSANSCLELNFIIQLMHYCQYSRHFFMLIFFSSEVNVIVDFAEKKSISAAALKYRLDRHSIRYGEEEKKEQVMRTFQLSNKK